MTTSLDQTPHPDTHPNITVTVNGDPVRLPDREVTGREIKQEAIDQGVAIQAGFQLSVRRADGRYKVVADDEHLRVHSHEDFLAVAPDDNS